MTDARLDDLVWTEVRPNYAPRTPLPPVEFAADRVAALPRLRYGKRANHGAGVVGWWAVLHKHPVRGYAAGPFPDCAEALRYYRASPYGGGKWDGPEPVNTCHACSDGECFWEWCPQLRDNEPAATGRHCPLDRGCARCCMEECAC